MVAGSAMKVNRADWLLHIPLGGMRHGALLTNLWRENLVLCGCAVGLVLEPGSDEGLDSGSSRPS